MAIKMTGAEWKKFYDDQTVWKGGAYHDDSCILVNGVNVDDDENLADFGGKNPVIARILDRFL